MDPSFSIEIFLLKEFKDILNEYINRTDLSKRFKPRLYQYADFVIVKLYAMVCDRSTEWAAEYLNSALSTLIEKKSLLKIKIFRDNKRKRRMVPHQTDVDKFFRLFSSKEVQFVFGNILTHLNLIIKKQEIGGANLVFIADNTKYPYYGLDRTQFELGYHDLPGTDVCRMFQGHMLHGCGISLFTDFHPIQFNVYRGISLRSSVMWLKFCKFNIKYACLDREFYRAAIMKDLKNQHIPTIMPAKKFGRVRTAFKKYLCYSRPISDKYLFSQGGSQYPFQKSALVNLALIGHDDQTAFDIREEMWSGKLSMDEAQKKLAGFFTTMDEWQNVNAWCRWLTRAYKKRWNIETGFSKLNQIHESYRNRYPCVQLAQLYLRAIIYNNWQYFSKVAKRLKMKNSARCLKIYQEKLSPKLGGILYRNSIDRVNNYLKKKKKVIFQ
jgi:hypothetical protein